MKPISFVQLVATAIACAVGASQQVSAQDMPLSRQAEGGAVASQRSSDSDPERSGIERGIAWAINKAGETSGAREGVYPALGGLIPGSGWLRGGAGYRHRLFGDAAVFSTSATMSAQRYALVQSTLEWPHLLSDRLSVGTQVKYQDFPQINYFGVGVATSKDAQTNYRLQNIDVTSSGTVRLREGLTVGGGLGYLRGSHAKPGSSTLHPSIEERFDDLGAPGLTVGSRYLHTDGFIESDSRDIPGYPTSGGVYRLGVASFNDLDASGHTFRRVDMDGAQYVPVFHNNWVLAVRGRVTFSQTSAGNDVPFYLLPTLGGGNTLRGYADFRFRDRDVALLSAEYRWPLFRMMDGALFVDAGTVASTPHALLQTPVRSDYGLGFRLHSETRSLARIDVARGAEGVRITATFSAPLGASHRTVAPYVP